MPLEPPWPLAVLDNLRAALDVLRRQAEANPHQLAIAAAAADVEAAIRKLEPIAKA